MVIASPSEETRLCFSEGEFADRLAAFRAVMEAHGADLLLIDGNELLFYLTGFDPSESLYRACLVPREGSPTMVIRHLDRGLFLERSWITRSVGFADWEDPVGAVAGKCRGARVIGLDLNSSCLPAARFAALRQALPEARFVDLSPPLAVLRLRKSAAEIDYLRRAAGVADGAMGRTIATVAAGTTPRQAAAVASHAFLQLGADDGRAGPITVSGFLHGGIDDRPLERGDILHMELTPKVRGYSARIMRPTVIGDPNDDLASAAAALIAVQDRQIAAMAPGVPAAEVDRICREGVMKAGLRDSYDNATGYTLGYYSRTATRSSDFSRVFLPGAAWVLEAGMVFHVYTSARGLGFSETVLVTDTGHERLTTSERTLFIRPDGAALRRP